MDVNDLKGLFAEVNKRMNTAIDHLRHELAGVRTGRASATLLDNVHVDAYGSRMPLNQLAGLSVPEPTLIVAQPFDPSQMAAIEKAIRASDLGLNPQSDGKVIRIPIPSLTEERRKELSRHVHKMSEEGRNSVRQVRRDANERLKKFLKDHQISEDDEKKGLDEVQKITDQHIKQIDERAEQEGPGSAGEVAGDVLDANAPIGGRRSHGICRSPFRSDVLLHPPRMLRAVRGAAARSTRPSPSLRLRRPPARPLRSRTGARLVARHPAVRVRRRCGAIGSCCRYSTAKNR